MTSTPSTTAATAHPAEGVPAPAVYAEARECTHCQHVGINDSADGVATCSECQWTGDSPKEDKCPDCEAEGAMTASCPKCHQEYRLLADATLAATPAAGVQDILRDFIEIWAMPQLEYSRKEAFNRGDKLRADACMYALLAGRDALASSPPAGVPAAAPDARDTELAQETIDDLAADHGLDFMAYTPFARAIEAAIASQAGNGVQ